MIGYITLGTNELAKAGAFYDAVLGVLGAKRISDGDRMIMWGVGPGAPMFAVCLPYDEKPATFGNGTMISLGTESREQAKQVYEAAIANGGADEGEPGVRGDGPFYGGYFRDLDGNKLVAFNMG